MDLEYSVTETMRYFGGKVSELNYEFEEITVETVAIGLTTKNERFSRLYSTRVSRDQYNVLSQIISVSLPFDEFVKVLRPFMLGFYSGEELEQAFNILDQDNSGTIHIDELGIFLPIVNRYANGETLRSYIRKVHSEVQNSLTYDEFRALILRGIGRDILCNNL